MAKIHLKGIGEWEAIPARDVVVGDVIIYDYGYRGVVRGKRFSRTGKSVSLDIEKDGYLYYDCVYGVDRLVVVMRVNGGVS